MLTAREVAVKALVKINNDGAYSNLSLDSLLTQSTLSVKDKALCSAITYGVLDRKISLDYIISKYLKKSIDKLSPVTHEALRIAIYQIAFMDKIPQSAAVNESVNIVKHSKEKYNAAFVNGVLRAYLRDPATLPSGNDLTSLSIRYSCPANVLEGFIKDYGLDTALSLLESSLNKPPVTIRVNTVKCTAEELIEKLSSEGITVRKSDKLKNALEISSFSDITALSSYKNGLFHVQDISSQITVSKIAPQPYERVFDTCAAPGGKSFTMAQYMDNKGYILSCDLYSSRLNVIKSGANRLGLLIIDAMQNDATVYNSKLGTFDAVLCDVPCSGLGVIRRKPDIKYKDFSNLSELEKTQSSILENADSYLKVGGRLLYSTCTLRQAENSKQIKTFLDKHGSYELKYERTFMPHIDGTDGFYCALLIKSR